MHKLNLQTGHSVEIREEANGQTLSIIPMRQRTVSLTEMVARITKKNQHSVVDWGEAIGKEAW